MLVVDISHDINPLSQVKLCSKVLQILLLTRVLVIASPI